MPSDGPLSTAADERAPEDPGPGGSGRRDEESAVDADYVAEADHLAEADHVAEAPQAPKHLWAVVMVFDIAVELPTPHALVTLREVAEPNRLFALPVGLPEATALAHAWRGVATPRPLTHELFAEVLVRLGATIEVVRLHGRRAGVVLAEMELSGPRGREVVGCRPTDGLTLSIRQGVPAPILLDQRLFEPEGDVDPDG